MSDKIPTMDMTHLVRMMPTVMEAAKRDPDVMAHLIKLVTSDEPAENLSRMASKLAREVNAMVPLEGGAVKAPEPWMPLAVQMAVCMTTLNVLANLLLRTSGDGDPRIPMEVAQVMSARATEKAMNEILSHVRAAHSAAKAAKNGGPSA